MLLYVLISDNGDGSYSPNFTLDSDLVEKMETMVYDNKPSFDFERWCDGDGFTYQTINVPDDSTYESLGISYPLLHEDVFETEDD